MHVLGKQFLKILLLRTQTKQLDTQKKKQGNNSKNYKHSSSKDRQINETENKAVTQSATELTAESFKTKV